MMLVVPGRYPSMEKPAKPSHEVKVGDIVELQFGARVLTAEILSLSEHVRKEEAADMYRILSEN